MRLTETSSGLAPSSSEATARLNVSIPAENSTAVTPESKADTTNSNPYTSGAGVVWMASVV